MLKLWTGKSWAWIKVAVCGQTLPDGWEQNSPQLVQHGKQWKLHIPIERKMEHPKKVATQITTSTETKICAVDLNINEHLAVCTILTAEGTVVATRFIGGGKQLHGLRKKQLGRIARKRDKIGIIAEGEQDNKHLWEKIRNLDEDAAHQVSHRIVEFASEHGASVLVFEYLANFQPQKGKYSRRGNEKRSYWLRGRIFRYSKYKAWNVGMVTCRVSPYNTSRECARCGEKVARYAAGQPEEGYQPGAPLVLCPKCHMRGNADRNASIKIGKRLLAKHQQKSQEKPPAPTFERSVKTDGVRRSQRVNADAEHSWHGTRYGLGTAQGVHEQTPRMLTQLRLFNE